MDLCHASCKQYKCSLKNLFADFKTMISNCGKEMALNMHEQEKNET